MVPGSVDLEDGIKAPPRSVFVEFFGEVLQEHSIGPVVGVGLHD